MQCTLYACFHAHVAQLWTLQRKSNLCTPRKKLPGLSPNFHIHVSVGVLYIPTIGPLFSCSRIDRPILGIYKSLTETWMEELGLRPRSFISGNICFEFSVYCLCSAWVSPLLGSWHFKFRAWLNAPTLCSEVYYSSQLLFKANFTFILSFIHSY